MNKNKRDRTELIWRRRKKINLGNKFKRKELRNESIHVITLDKLKEGQRGGKERMKEWRKSWEEKRKKRVNRIKKGRKRRAGGIKGGICYRICKEERLKENKDWRKRVYGQIKVKKNKRRN